VNSSHKRRRRNNTRGRRGLKCPRVCRNVCSTKKNAEEKDDETKKEKERVERIRETMGRCCCYPRINERQNVGEEGRAISGRSERGIAGKRFTRRKLGEGKQPPAGEEMRLRVVGEKREKKSSSSLRRQHMKKLSRSCLKSLRKKGECRELKGPKPGGGSTHRESISAKTKARRGGRGGAPPKSISTLGKKKARKKLEEGGGCPNGTLTQKESGSLGINSFSVYMSEVWKRRGSLSGKVLVV